MFTHVHPCLDMFSVGHFWCFAGHKQCHIQTLEGSSIECTQPKHRGKSTDLSWQSKSKEAPWRSGKYQWVELARDIERLLERAFLDLLALNRNAELHYHLLKSLPEKVALQLKLSPRTDYPETISKARQLIQLFKQVDMTTVDNQVQSSSNEDCLRCVEEALQ